MKNENNAIRIHDLCFSILHGWKWIVVTVLALALIFGLVQGIFNRKAVVSEESIAALNARIDTQVAYLENSIYMQLDPYNVYEATANLYMTADGNALAGDADSLDMARYICAYYYTALNDNAMYIHLTDITEVMPNYLKELITLDNSNSPILTVKVCHNSAQQADILLQEILDYARNEIPAVAEGYDLQVNVAATVSTIRTDIHAKQIQEQTSLDTAKAELADLVAPSWKQVVKTAIVGGILGGVLSVLILAFNNKRHSAKAQ